LADLHGAFIEKQTGQDRSVSSRIQAQRIKMNNVEAEVPLFTSALMHGFTKDAYHEGLELLEKYIGTDLGPELLEKVKGVDVGSVFDELDSTQEYATLSHGDLYVNNILFDPSSNQDDSRHLRAIIDFQFCNWGRPCNDVQLLLCSSVSPSLRRESAHQFLKEYHDRILQYLPPSLFTWYALRSTL
tara:strand:+ start:208 stop:765 length:558 start_codon:yes stop_codon:yes gene_type:complete